MGVRVQMIAQHGAQRQMFHLVVFGRAGAVGVDVVDLAGLNAGVDKRFADGADHGGAIGARACPVIVVGLFAGTAHDAEDGGTTRLGAVIAFEHDGTGAFGNHEAVAPARERPRRLFRLVVSRRQCGQKRKPDQAFRMHGRVGADAQGGIGLAPADRLHAHLNRACAGCARGAQRHRHALRAETRLHAVCDAGEFGVAGESFVTASVGAGQQPRIAGRCGIRRVLEQLQHLRPFEF